MCTGWNPVESLGWLIVEIHVRELIWDYVSHSSLKICATAARGDLINFKKLVCLILLTLAYSGTNKRQKAEWCGKRQKKADDLRLRAFRGHVVPSNGLRIKGSWI
jgi:hypothetical protein